MPFLAVALGKGATLFRFTQPCSDDGPHATAHCPRCSFAAKNEVTWFLEPLVKLGHEDEGTGDDSGSNGWA